METKRIYESDLVGGSRCKVQIWPVTSTQAVYSHDANGDMPDGVEPILEDRLQAIESGLSTCEKTLKAIADALGVEYDDDGNIIVPEVPSVEAISLEDIRALVAEGDAGEIIEYSSASDDGI